MASTNGGPPSGAAEAEQAPPQLNVLAQYVKANFPAIPSSQYSSKGYGFSRPIASNANDAGRARNRRRPPGS